MRKVFKLAFDKKLNGYCFSTFDKECIELLVVSIFVCLLALTAIFSKFKRSKKMIMRASLCALFLYFVVKRVFSFKSEVIFKVCVSNEIQKRKPVY
jgi:hypothetical protein